MAKIESWEALRDLCEQNEEGEAAEHWAYDEDCDLDTVDELHELLQTGSVTTEVAYRWFEISLCVKEIPMPARPKK